MPRPMSLNLYLSLKESCSPTKGKYIATVIRGGSNPRSLAAALAQKSLRRENPHRITTVSAEDNADIGTSGAREKALVNLSM